MGPPRRTGGDEPAAKIPGRPPEPAGGGAAQCLPADYRLGACRIMGDRNEGCAGTEGPVDLRSPANAQQGAGTGERGQFAPEPRSIAGLCDEDRGGMGPLSHFHSRVIHSPTGS